MKLDDFRVMIQAGRHRQTTPWPGAGLLLLYLVEFSTRKASKGSRRQAAGTRAQNKAAAGVSTNTAAEPPDAHWASDSFIISPGSGGSTLELAVASRAGWKKANGRRLSA